MKIIHEIINIGKGSYGAGEGQLTRDELLRIYDETKSISSLILTTIGSSGPAVYNPATRVLNIPNYTQESSQGFVPYTGATQNVNLGDRQLVTDAIQFNLLPTALSAKGKLKWDPDFGTLEIGMGVTNVFQKIGSDNYFPPIRNQTGSIIPRGTVVMSVGALSSPARILVAPAVANGSVSSKLILGITVADIADQSDGLAMKFGQIKGFNTVASAPIGETWVNGDLLWVNPAVPGGLTKIEPSAPNIKVSVALVIIASTNGAIMVRPSLGLKLTDLHDVDAFNPNNKDLISYSSSLGHWNSTSFSQYLGGAVTQYVRGDGTLADFPLTSGGGSSVSYYLNGSVSQGLIGGAAYKEVNKVPVFGAGTDLSISTNGYIASFITDASDPGLIEIPAGNWNFETYFSASSSGGTPSFYVELYKYDGVNFTLIASNATTPELIAFGTIISPYFSTLAVPQTTLAITDRLALRYYVDHSGRTIVLHTEDNHLCQIITTFTTGLTTLNGLTDQVQYFSTGSSGTDFNVSSASGTHTFNIPTASSINRGLLSNADWIAFDAKVSGSGSSGQVAIWNGTTTQVGNAGLLWDAINNILDITGGVKATGTLEVDTVNNGTGDFVRVGASGVFTKRTPAETLDDIGASSVSQVTPVTVLVSSFALVSGLYEASISNAGILATSIVDVIPSNASFTIVSDAQFLPQTDSSVGSVKVYCVNLPAGDFTVTLNITNP